MRERRRKSRFKVVHYQCVHSFSRKQRWLLSHAKAAEVQNRYIFEWWVGKLSNYLLIPGSHFSMVSRLQEHEFHGISGGVFGAPPNSSWGSQSFCESSQVRPGSLNYWGSLCGGCYAGVIFTPGKAEGGDSICLGFTTMRHCCDHSVWEARRAQLIWVPIHCPNEWF